MMAPTTLESAPPAAASASADAASQSDAAGTSSTNAPATAELQHRAIHKIHLDALEHNFSEVESAANRQRCSVITVVKADGYGHGAVPTALHLADRMGAEAFAVATLEEGIALRKAFQQQAKELFPNRHAAHASSAQAAAVPTAENDAGSTPTSSGNALHVPASNNLRKSATSPKPTASGSTIAPSSAGLPVAPALTGKTTIQSLFTDPNATVPSLASTATTVTTITSATTTPTATATTPMAMATPIQLPPVGADNSTIASQPSSQSLSTDARSVAASHVQPNHTKRPVRHSTISRRPAHVQIIVLGPPVGFPRCFDDYAHYSIDCMVSGPEVAAALREWVLDREQRQYSQVERAAMETKEWALTIQPKHAAAHVVLAKNKPNNAAAAATSNGTRPADGPVAATQQPSQGTTTPQEGASANTSNSDGIPSVVTTSSQFNDATIDNDIIPTHEPRDALGTGLADTANDSNTEDAPVYRAAAATLSNVTGGDLAKEVRAILMAQKVAAETQQHFKEEHEKMKQQKQQQQQQKAQAPATQPSVTTLFQPEATGAASTAGTQTSTAAASTNKSIPDSDGGSTVATSTMGTVTAVSTKTSSATFAGIEEAAKMSRTRQHQQRYQACNSFGSSFGAGSSTAAVADDSSKTFAVVSGGSLSANPDAISEVGVAPPDLDGAGDVPAPVPTATTKTVDPPENGAATTEAQPTIAASASAVSLTSSTNTPPLPPHANGTARAPPPTATRKRPLRWHALIDTGMGRLGFRTDPPTEPEAKSETDSQQQQPTWRDTVEILKELVELEYTNPSVLEFYGMQTHMADASNALSKFTDQQVQKFKSLLKRVRGAGISVPMLSVDNSAALLTPSLQHFDPHDLLKQPDGVDSRGFVRVGGAIFGQRPFAQIKPISTLYASVRHVATLGAGESVGYDRVYEAPATGAIIATLTIGFADGYPRELGRGVGKVCIRGNQYPVAGNVCMDMLMVYLGCPTDRTGAHNQIKVGDTAVLWGPMSETDGPHSGTDGVYMADDRVVTMDRPKLPGATGKDDTATRTDPNVQDGDNGQSGAAMKLSSIASTLKTTQSALTCGLNKTRVLRQYA